MVYLHIQGQKTEDSFPFGPNQFNPLGETWKTKAISAAKLDAVGIFGYSDEDNTEALDLSDKVDEEVIKERVEALSSLADEMVSTRAQARIGETVRVLIEDADLQEGRAAHQGPEVDGSTSFIGTSFKVGQYVDAVIVDSLGADLVAEAL